MARAIGIDLGTTNSVMAYLRGEQVETIKNFNSNPLTPSVVGIDEYEAFLVGENAKAQAVYRPENTVFSIKRFMGRNFRDADIQHDIRQVPYAVMEAENGEVEVRLGRKTYSPPQISAEILKAMKEMAEEQIGEITHAVITVPAYFGQRQKDATRTAGQLAGLEVMRIIPEPKAAALAYGMRTQSTEDKTLLVYDLGGGTFDVTVLVVAGGLFTDVAITGNNHLGGDEFDQTIIDYIIADTQQRHRVDLRGNKKALQSLKVAAEKAKIELSNRPKVPIVIPNIVREGGRAIDILLELTREKYEGFILKHVQKTIDLVHEAIQEANFRPEDIDQILLAGGSTMTPLVIESLRREFGSERILRKVNPMECVAQGAAIQTGIKTEEPSESKPHFVSKPGRPGQIDRGNPQSVRQPENECPHCGRLVPIGQSKCMYCEGIISGPGFVSVDVLPKPLGIQTEGDKMEVLVGKGEPYPTQRPFTRHFRTTRPGQTILVVPVYEGFNEVASQNEFLGIAEGDLPPGLPDATEVAVSFSVDADGIIYVTAELPDRPGISVNAKIDMAHRKQAASMPGAGQGGPRQPPKPADWREEAQMALGFASMALNKGDRYMDRPTATRLRNLGAELQQAIEMDNESLGRRKKAELEGAVNDLGPVMLLAFAATLAEMDIVSPLESRELNSLLQEAEQAVRFGRMNQLNTILSQLDQKMRIILERVQGEGGELGGFGDGLLGGLLRS